MMLYATLGLPILGEKQGMDCWIINTWSHYKTNHMVLQYTFFSTHIKFTHRIRIQHWLWTFKGQAVEILSSVGSCYASKLLPCIVGLGFLRAFSGALLGFWHTTNATGPSFLASCLGIGLKWGNLILMTNQSWRPTRWYPGQYVTYPACYISETKNL